MTERGATSDPGLSPGWLERVDGVAAWLFDGGWRFLVPYFALYGACYLLALPVAAVGALFRVSHVALGLVFLRYAWRRRRSWSAGAALFWGGLSAVLLLPGAYLEFPSDPWEHAVRIFSWNNAASFENHLFASRVPYFWSWSLVGEVPSAGRRTALTLLSAFSQLLIAVQLAALARRLGASPGWAMAQVAGTVCLFGNVFGFLRYYALASTALAYVAYLAALRAGLDIAEDRRRSLPDLLLACGLMAASHLQELLLFAVSSLAIVGHAVWRRPATRELLLRVLPRALVAGTLLAGLYLSVSGTALRYPPAQLGDVLDGSALVGLGLAVVLWSRLGVLAALCLVPPLVLTWPPTALALERLLAGRPDPLAWRVLYSFPTSFATVAAIRLAATAARARWGRHAGAAVVAAGGLGILAVGLQAEAPVRGRLWFVLHQPSPGLSLEFADDAAAWLGRNWLDSDGTRGGTRVVPAQASVAWQQPPPYRDVRGSSCVLVTDSATAVGLGLHFDVWSRALRRPYQRPAPLAVGLDEFLDRVRVCGFLVAEVGPEVASGESRVGALSGHWPPSVVRDDLLEPPAFSGLPAALAGRGWQERRVPPFYRLWSPGDGAGASTVSP